MAQTLDLAAAVAQDTARWINSGERPGFDIPTSLAHAARQARERNFQDMLIVDVDSHHNELNLWSEMTPYIEDPVLRHRVLDEGSLLHQATQLNTSGGGGVWGRGRRGPRA